jgi:hypothetical protein
MAKKIVGNALYMEMRRGRDTSQVLVIPPMMNPITGMRQKMVLLTRNIDPTVQRRSWRFYSSKADPIMEPEMNYEVAVDLAAPLVREIASFLSGYAAGEWLMYKTPLMVEMTTDDLMDIADTKTPNALLRRVLVARKEGGFTDSLFNEPVSLTTPAPAGYTL